MIERTVPPYNPDHVDYGPVPAYSLRLVRAAQPLLSYSPTDGGTQIKIVSPADWGITSQTPTIEVECPLGIDLHVEIATLQAYTENTHSPAIIASTEAIRDSTSTLCRAVFRSSLPDGRYVVLVCPRSSDRRVLTVRGITVDSYAEVKYDYSVLVDLENKRIERETGHMRESIEYSHTRTVFGIVIEADSGGSVIETIQSLQKQTYPDFHYLVVRAPQWYASMSATSRDYIIPLRAGDVLSPNALYEIANHINIAPYTDLVYADEDIFFSREHRSSPFYKPAWSPDYLETFNYIGYPAAFRSKVAACCLGSNGYYDFVLRFTEMTDNITHLRKTLCHRSAKLIAIAPAEVERDRAALENRLARTNRKGQAVPLQRQNMGWEIKSALRSTPLVSIVLPTAGRSTIVWDNSIDLVTHCVTTIRRNSTYPALEIVIVDNGDLSISQTESLESHGCRFATYKEEGFNISNKLNLGVQHAAGEFVILMNDDMEVITPDWIERMLCHFEKPHVGVVGCKLLYPDDTIQHAGVAHNNGDPDHVRRGFSRYDSGYFLSTCGVRNFSGVTGACQMVRTDIYRDVGGYTASLAESFNDIDFCQKVRLRGLYVVYTPHAEIYHFESQSRSPRLIQNEIDYYRSRWAPELIQDPFYNEQNLTLSPPTFEPVISRRMF